MRSMMDAAQPPTADSSMCARPVAETTNGLHVEDLHEISSERDTEWTESLMDERETELYSIKCVNDAIMVHGNRYIITKLLKKMNKYKRIKICRA